MVAPQINTNVHSISHFDRQSIPAENPGSRAGESGAVHRSSGISDNSARTTDAGALGRIAPPFSDNNSESEGFVIESP